MRSQLQIRKKFRDPVKLDLKIELENFGPITKGSVHLKPLTIFVGPNNSGKSYVAMLIHSIISAENQVKRSRNFEFGDYFELFGSSVTHLHKIINANKKELNFDIPAKVVEKIHATTIQDLFAAALESSINRNFGSPASDLVRSRQKTAKITISNSAKLGITISDKLNVKTHDVSYTKYRIKTSMESETPHFSSKTNDEHVISVGRDYVVDEFLRESLPEDLIELISKNMFHSDIPEDSFYFSATRAGILQGHQVISASLIKNAPFAGIEPIQIPKLTGTVSDFISDILLLPTRPGPFSDLAERLEKDLLHGSIKRPPTARGSLPEITYHSEYSKIPLYRTSSAITEIAPVSLYLKYIVHPSSLLIIEEPEAHLHPYNQLIFAKYIARMIRAGLNVLITTHSVVMLEKLEKLMLASKLESDVREQIGDDKDNYLLPEEISPYVFVQDGDENNRIVPIKINEEGISQEEFIRISEQLHSESIILQDNLAGHIQKLA